VFNSLTGRIVEKRPGSVYLLTGGVEWDIAVPDASADNLPAVGEEARIYTYLLHRDDQMKLFGFAHPSERLLFLELMKVDGVGPRQALRVLSVTPPDVLVQLLDEGDADAIARTPGIGKKTAQKIILALRGKLRLDETSAPSGFDDIVAALVEMGFDRKTAEEAVTAVRQEHPSADESTPLAEDELMRRAIVRLSGGR
jgi:holliday junction DNA helicase RuvA